MMYYIKLLAIVFAVSVDGFGVGISYGMRQIRLSFPALLIIMLSSGTIVCLSMTIGHLIRSIVKPEVASLFGSSILILLGCIVLLTKLKEKFHWRLFPKKSGSHTGLFTAAHQADKDQSGIISAGESVILGIALAMDAFGAGFGAAVLGYPVLLTSILVGFMSGAFLYAGTRFGILIAQSNAMRKLTFLPPILLIGIGTFNMLH